MKKLGPAVEGQAVADERLDRPAEAGNALHGGLAFEAPLLRVKLHQLAHPRMIMVTTDDGDDLAGMTRDRAGVEE